MNSLDSYELNYEKYSETKAHRTRIRKRTNSAWVATCDFIYDTRKKLSRVLGFKTARASKKRS